MPESDIDLWSVSNLRDLFPAYKKLRELGPVVWLERAGLGGVELDAGSRVLVLIGSANRDERRFERPDDFDVTRNPRNHLGFGRGVHHCAVSTLARVETTALLGELAERVERFRIEDHEWADVAALLVLDSLNVELVEARV